MDEALRKAIVHFLRQVERGDQLVEDLLLISVDWGDDTPSVTDDSTSLDFQGTDWTLVFTDSELVLRRELCRSANKQVILVYRNQDDLALPGDIRARAHQARSCRLGLRHHLYALTGQDWPPEVDYAEWRPTVERHLDALIQGSSRRGLNWTVSRSELEEMLVEAAFGLTVQGHDAPKLLALLTSAQRRSPQAPTELDLSLLRGQLRLHRVESMEDLMWAAEEPGRAEELIRTGLMMGAEEAARRMPNWGSLSSLRGILVGERRMAGRDAAAQVIEIATSALQDLHRATRKSIVSAAEEELIDVLPEGAYNPWFPEALERETRRLAQQLAARDAKVCGRVPGLTDHLFADQYTLRLAVLNEMSHLVKQWEVESSRVASLDTVADWACWYARYGSGLDTTALKLMRAQQRGTELDEPIRILLDDYWHWRDGLNGLFSRKFVHNYEASLHGRDAGVFGTHRILDWVVRPLLDAGQRVVLLIVDGMGFAAFHHLAEQWAEQTPPVYAIHSPGVTGGTTTFRPGSPPHAVLSLLPSITSVSRKALFLNGLPTDRLDDEKTYQEKARTSETQGLQGAFEDLKVKVYDKSNIDGGQRIYDDIQFQGANLIAVILNAIDDDLKSTTATVRLPDLENIGPLVNIARRAIEAGWKVIMTADHGHTWHRSKQLRRGDVVEGGGGRFAPVDLERDAPEDAAVTRDPHILRVQDGERMALLTATGAYFGRHPRRGYHGGAALEEVVVPCAFLTYEAPTVRVKKEGVTTESPESGPGQPDGYDLSGVVLTLPNGQVRSLDLPFSPSPREVRLLQTLAQLGEASEADLKQALGTRRIAGPLASLQEKLAAERLDYIEYQGTSSRGAIYRFRTEMLE